jgi:hypothetical protein
VPHTHLWYKLEEYGFHGKMLLALKSLYKDIQCRVRVNGNMTEYFRVQCGLTQGCLLSPFLFNMYINELCMELKALNNGIDINGESINSLLYADDLVLMAQNENDLQEMLNTLECCCTKWKMNINYDKSKVMHIRPQSVERSRANFNCGCKPISFIDRYKYLGLIFNEYLDMSETVKNVAQSANRALGLLIAKVKANGGVPFDVYTKLYMILWCNL